MASTLLRAPVLALLFCACASDDDGDSTGADTGTPTTMVTDTGSEDTAPAEGASSSSPSSTADDGAASDDTAPGESSEGPASSDDGSDATAGESSGGDVPTSGPGVLPGESGLEAFCRRYVECGGTYYADQQACIDASTGYWGECASRIAAQDTFGACMSEIECSDWSPDAYNPASTPCAEQWQELGASDPC